MNRYIRQIILRDFGIESQKKLLDSHVMLIGAGGLGCSALTYLGAAGVGKITVIDGDRVHLNNLNRQVLYGHEDIGKYKAETAALRLSNQYKDIKINCVSEFLCEKNAEDLLKNGNLIIDASDSFECRLLLDKYCKILKKPLIHGSIYQSQGQLALLHDPKIKFPASYSDLFPQLSSDTSIPTCSQTGVLGVLPGIIGTLQASEAIKWITGFHPTLSNKLLVFDLLTYSTRIFTIKSAETQHTRQSAIENRKNSRGISVKELWYKLNNELIRNPILIDLREFDESPVISSEEIMRIPFSVLLSRESEFENYDTIVFMCASGKRSKLAYDYYVKKWPHKSVLHVFDSAQEYLSYISTDDT